MLKQISKSALPIFKHLEVHIAETCSQHSITPVTIQQLTAFGDKCANEDEKVDTLFSIAVFLREQIPIRLAHMIRELSLLPSALGDSVKVQQIKQGYSDSYLEFMRCPEFVVSPHTKIKEPVKLEFVENITHVVQQVLERHESVVSVMAQGVSEFQQLYTSAAKRRPDKQFHRATSGFLGIRTLLIQYISLQNSCDSPDGVVGVVNKRTNVRQIAEDAATRAKLLCDMEYGAAPDFTFKGSNVKFPYLPHHLDLILFELIKNSMRAVVESNASETACVELPDVEMRATKVNSEITIKLSDTGGGITSEELERLFYYTYTTASRPITDVVANMRNAPLAGLGYGLPISRLYARYFGGDLKLVSLPGYGTDVYVSLKDSHLAEENLPTYAGRKHISKLFNNF